MLKFFRTIRRRLLDTGKVRNYLVYAIGEILLVVIGILIALQINAWNQSRLDRKKEQSYLKNLLSDLRADKEGLEFEVSLAERRLKHRANLRAFFAKEENMSFDTLFILQKALSLSAFTPFRSFSPTFDDLKSSGNLQLIRNSKIKDQMGGYFYRLKLFESMLYENDQQIKQLYNDKLFEYINPEIKSLGWKKGLLNEGELTLEDFKANGFDLAGFTNDTEFLNRLNKVIGAESELKVWYEVLLKQNLEPIISLIEKEIK